MHVKENPLYNGVGLTWDKVCPPPHCHVGRKYACRGERSFILEWQAVKQLEGLFKLNLQHCEWPTISMCNWCCGLGGSMQSPHSVKSANGPSSRFSIYMYMVRGCTAWVMLFSWDKSVNICPFTTYKNCPIIQWGSLHSSTLNDIAFTSSSSLIAFSF